MVHPEGFVADSKVMDRHGITDTGPLFFGGVSFLTPATGLFTDTFMIQQLRTEQKFRAYLEFREQAFKLAAQELVASCNSPIDLFIHTEYDEKLFRNSFFKYLALRDQYSMIVADGSEGRGAESLSTHSVLNEDQLNHIRRENEKEALLKKLHGVRRYFAYRKGLLKLDFIKWNSDPEEVLKWIKKSTRWSELRDDELKRGLERHMELLKRHMSKMTSTPSKSSLSEFENAALEEINSLLSSELERHLYISDQWLMREYFNRMKMKNLAREIYIQAQRTGVILVDELLPVKRHMAKQMILPRSLPLMKQTAKQSLESTMGYLHRQGAVRVKALGLLVFGVVSAISINMASKNGHKTAN